MLETARGHLADAEKKDLKAGGRFLLVYTAAHKLALTALRLQGYRSEDRITVFQTIVHTLSSDHRNDVRIFLKAHSDRNLSEYEGHLEVDDRFLDELIACTKSLEKAVAKLDPPTGD